MKCRVRSGLYLHSVLVHCPDFIVLLVLLLLSCTIFILCLPNSITPNEGEYTVHGIVGRVKVVFQTDYVLVVFVLSLFLI